MNIIKGFILGVLAVMLFQTGTVSANVISYDLSNKQVGTKADPDYGLRLDDLFTTPAESNWTFAFSGAGTNMQMDIDTGASTVRIFGTVVGGRDTGSVWATATKASWELDFLYSYGVTIDDMTTGYWTIASTADNFGSLKLLDDVNVDGITGTDQGKYIGLADYHGGSFAYTSDRGPYVSAWLESTDGLIASNTATALAGETYVRPNGGDKACCKDFGFRATPTAVPEPASLALMSVGLLGIGFVRRRKKS